MPTLDPTGDVLAQLEDSVALIAHEAQTAFAERYAGFDWRVDLTEPAVFWFEREPRAILRPHFIGSVSGGSNTWLWGWENINNFPASVVDISNSLRGLGEQVGETRFTTAQLDLAQDGEALVHSLVRAAMAVSGISTYYRAPTGPDSYAWFLVDNPDEFALDDPQPALIAAMLGTLLSGGLITDPRRAVSDYAERRAGVDYSEADGGSLLILTMAAGTLAAQLDDEGRIVELRSPA